MELVSNNDFLKEVRKDLLKEAEMIVWRKEEGILEKSIDVLNRKKNILKETNWWTGRKDIIDIQLIYTITIAMYTPTKLKKPQGSGSDKYKCKSSTNIVVLERCLY